MEAEKFICDHCGREYQDLAAHLRWHPECDDDGDMPELHEDSDDYDFEDGFDLEAAQDAFEGMRERNDLKDLVALDLADERLEHGNGNADVDRLKRKVDAWVKERDASAHLALKPLLRPGVTAEQVQAALGSRGIFEGIETAKTEMAYTKQRVPYIEPRVVQLSEDKDDTIVSFDIGELLERDLQSNANLRRRMIETSDRLKTGELYRKVPDGEIADVIEAAEARFHARLWRPATDDEKDDLRVPLIFNCDEVEARATALIAIV